MRRETTSVSQEDYLKAIWEMLEEEEIPISARVAEQLGRHSTCGNRCAQAHDARRLSAHRSQRTYSPHRERAAASRSISRCVTNSPKNFSPKLSDSIGPKRMTKPSVSSTPSLRKWKRCCWRDSARTELVLTAFRFLADSQNSAAAMAPCSSVKSRRALTVEILCVYERDPKFLLFLAGLKLKPGVRLRVIRREYDQTMLRT